MTRKGMTKTVMVEMGMIEMGMTKTVMVEVCMIEMGMIEMGMIEMGMIEMDSMHLEYTKLLEQDIIQMVMTCMAYKYLMEMGFSRKIVLNGMKWESIEMAHSMNLDV
jgi:hypothetical protein